MWHAVQCEHVLLHRGIQGCGAGAKALIARSEREAGARPTALAPAPTSNGSHEEPKNFDH